MDRKYDDQPWTNNEKLTLQQKIKEEQSHHKRECYVKAVVEPPPSLDWCIREDLKTFKALFDKPMLNEFEKIVLEGARKRLLEEAEKVAAVRQN